MGRDEATTGPAVASRRGNLRDNGNIESWRMEGGAVLCISLLSMLGLIIYRIVSHHGYPRPKSSSTPQAFFSSCHKHLTIPHSPNVANWGS